MTKPKKKSVQIREQKLLDKVHADLEVEWEKARLESITHGMAYLAVFPEGYFRHIPLEAIAKGFNGPKE